MAAPRAPIIPLARWADRRLGELGRETRSPAIAALTGAMLLGERAGLNGFAVPGLVSAGGGCRLLRARDGWIALNLARLDDRDLLPALFGDEALDAFDDEAIAERVAQSDSEALLAQGRLLGLAIAGCGEVQQAPAMEVLARASPAILSLSKDCPSSPCFAPGSKERAVLRQAQDERGWGRRPEHRRPLVLDLSALWAGPLAGHLLWLAGAEVVKIESPGRPDALRDGDPALFARLNQGKSSVTIDFATKTGRAALLALIARTDLVIEAARPRALLQLGVDADELVAARSGLVWLTITGHGARGQQADWIGFGDDTAVAGGLSAALVAAGGEMGFGGDAPGDPLTGIAAALAGWRAWRSGKGQRIGLAMSRIVADALADERHAGAAGLTATLRAWSGTRGGAYPAHPVRPVTAPVPTMGADNAAWLAC